MEFKNTDDLVGDTSSFGRKFRGRDGTGTYSYQDTGLELGAHWEAIKEESRKNEAIRNAIKHDTEKVEYCYMSPIALEKLNKVLSFGAKKYAAHNWRSGFKFSRIISAIFRHLFAYLKGETHDPETGISHIAHAMCECMFLLEFEETHPELDDRYKGLNNEKNICLYST